MLCDLLYQIKGKRISGGDIIYWHFQISLKDWFIFICFKDIVKIDLLGDFEEIFCFLLFLNKVVFQENSNFLFP